MEHLTEKMTKAADTIIEIKEMYENMTSEGNKWWGLFGGIPGMIISSKIVENKRTV